jgi:hypothetical protein
VPGKRPVLQLFVPQPLPLTLTLTPTNPNQVSDLHCNCSFRNLFGPPLPFAVLEEELPTGNLTAEHFQATIK